jgi:two-component system, response regulator YesN
MKESKVYLKVSITIIVCVVIAIIITSSILYVNFQSILMKHEYETNLERMESEEKQRLQLSNIALNTLYQIYNDISITKLLTFEKINPIEASAAFIQLRYFLVTIPNVDSIYVYNMKNDRIFDVSNESELIRPWNTDYYKRSNFYDSTAVSMIDNCTDYIPFIAVPRYYQVNKNTTKCVYTYIMYDIFKNSNKRNAIMLNLESEYLFQEKKPNDTSTRSLVVDKDGKVIYSNSVDFTVLDNVKDEFDIETKMKNDKSGYYITQINGEKSVVIYTHMDKYGWRDISIINYNDLLSQVKKLQSVTILITVFIASIGLVASFLGSIKVSAPIRVMSNDIKTLQSEKRQADTITKGIKLKELLENGGLESGGRPVTGVDFLSLLGLPFDKKKKLILLSVNVDDYQYLLETSNSQIINTYKFAAVNILNELLGESVHSYCLDMRSGKSLLFIVVDKNEPMEFLDNHIIHMQRLVNEYFQVSMSIDLSDFLEEPNKLYYLYEQIEEISSRSIFWQKGSIIHFSDMNIQEVQNYEYPENKEKQLIECLTHGKAKIAEEIYLSIVTETYQYPIVIYNMVISRLIFMIHNVVNLIMKNSSIHSLTSSIILANLMQEIDTIEERNTKFCELFIQIQKDQENKRNDKLSQLIVDINLQIEKEYANPLLSIEMIAEEVDMSVAYICRIYKQYTGSTINETLLNKRMEQARTLLTRSSLSVSIISEKVGFTSDSYFYRAFKKVNGVTPNEYRRKKDSCSNEV